VGVTKTFTILIATFLFDKVGRRSLALSSSAGMVVSLIGLGTGLTVVRHHPDATWAVALCIVSILAFVSFFSIGLGPIASVYTSEIFPLRVRALGFAVGVACNRVTSGVVSMTFLSLSKAITIGGSFFLYTGITAVAWVFFFTCLPETRGRALESMGKLFGMEDTGLTEAENAASSEKAVELPTK
jgi:MFS family permease